MLARLALARHGSRRLFRVLRGGPQRGQEKTDKSAGPSGLRVPPPGKRIQQKLADETQKAGDFGDQTQSDQSARTRRPGMDCWGSSFSRRAILGTLAGTAGTAGQWVSAYVQAGGTSPSALFSHT